MTEPTVIAVLGGPFAGGPDFLEFFRAAHGATLVRQPVNGTDQVLIATFADPELGHVEITAPIPPLVDPESMYRSTTAQADGLAWMLCSARSARSANERDSRLFWRVYDGLGRQCPVVVAVNDFWCGRAAFELESAEALRDLMRPGVDVCETRLRTLVHGGCVDGASKVWGSLRGSLLAKRAV